MVARVAGSRAGGVDRFATEYGGSGVGEPPGQRVPLAGAGRHNVRARRSAVEPLRRDVSVAYLLDQSESIPAEYRGEMLRYVTDNVERHRQEAKGDRAAVIVFGREAAVEVPPVEFARAGAASNRKSTLRPRISLTLWPRQPHSCRNSSARRVVVVTDGNENLGAAARQSQQLMQAGIGVDVIPTPTGGKQDVAVESVAAPSAAKKDQPLEVRVVLNNQGEDPQPAKGKLRIVRKSGGSEETIAEEAMTLPVGKSVFSFRETPTESDFYVYEARFTT